MALALKPPTVRAAITAATAPAVGDHQPYDASAGALAPSLPQLTAAMVSQAASVTVEKSKSDTSMNTVTVTCAAGDTFVTGSTTLALLLPGERITVQAASIGGSNVWKVTAHTVPRDSGDDRWRVNGPSYAPRGLLGCYEPRRNVYNHKGSNTRKLRAGLGRAAAGAGLCHIVVVGDSTSANALGGTNFDPLSMWSRVMRNLLAASLGIPVGGSGFVTAAETSGTADEPRWTFTGTWTQSNAYRASSAAGQTATFSTATVGGEVGRFVTLYYFGTSAAFTITVDGAAPANGAVTVTAGSYAGGTVTPAGGLTVQSLTVDTGAGGANSTHSITMTTSSASNTFVIGAKVEGTTGLVVHNIAQYGATAAAWADSSSATGVTAIRKMVVPASPDAVFIQLGVNDKTAGTADATVIAALTTIRGYWATADVLLVAQYQPTGATLAVWQAYIAKLYSLADTFDCPLFDLTDRSGGYTIANANGAMGDGNHPNAGSNRDQGRSFALALAA